MPPPCSLIFTDEFLGQLTLEKWAFTDYVQLVVEDSETEELLFLKKDIPTFFFTGKTQR